MLTRFLIYLQLVVWTWCFSQSAEAGPVLSRIQTQQQLRCGVSHGVVGFSGVDGQGRWQGLDVAFCKALAAAVLKDASKVSWVPLSSQQRFAALDSHQIDVLSRNTTWTLSRDVGLGLRFAGVWYYDGQGILVPKRLGISSAKQLHGAEICVQSGTTNEKNLNAFLQHQGIKAKAIVYDQFEAASTAFFAGRCQAFSTDVSALVGLTVSKTRQPNAYVVLPEVFSKEPLGPAVQLGDDAWFNIVRWVLFALMQAEELGVDAQLAQHVLSLLDNTTPSRQNVSALKLQTPKTAFTQLPKALQTLRPEAKSLLGLADDLGKPLGLDRFWAARAIAAGGHYGELFEANLGQRSPLKLPRGLNAPWTQGGLHYAPPVR